MAFAETIVFFLIAYFAVGVVVALLFLIFAVSRLDAAAEGASPFFRPIIFLGCASLWPFIILRVVSFRKINQPHEEKE